MTLIILGVLLWSAAHLFRRVAPERRDAMGDAGKGVVAVATVASVVLMVIGYRSAESVPLWYLGDAALGVNNILMLIAIGFTGIGHSKSRLRAKFRHPMLLGLILWSFAHLMVNGDLESILLFGGLGIWAIVQIWAINRTEPEPEPYLDGTLAGDVRLTIMTLVIVGVVMGIHIWFGLRPYPG